MTTDLTLRATDSEGRTTRVDIAVASGGRVRQITVTEGAAEVNLLASTDPSAPAYSTGWGSFPMAPWAGRLRHGRFRFAGRTVQLALNHADGSGTGGGPVEPVVTPSAPLADDDRRHAIHGTVFTRPWHIVHSGEQQVELTCPLTGSLGWDLAGLARQRITLTDAQLLFELSVEPSPGVEFPASIGWHPWFAKPARLDFAPVSMYTRDSIGLPTGELVAPGPPPWDDCFVNREPVRLHYVREIASCVTVTSEDCDHWVVFDEPPHATCVEPQSGPPDALNLRPELATSDHPLRRTMTIGW